MARKNRETSADDDGSQPISLWKPKKRGKRDWKRRIEVHNPADLARDWPEATDESLVALLRELGPEFELEERKRRMLLEGINDMAIACSQCFSHKRDEPSRSEYVERLRSIEKTAIKLYDLFGIDATPEDAWEQGIVCAQMNRNLWDKLRVGAHGRRRLSVDHGSDPRPAPQPDDSLLSSAVVAVAALSIFARRARQALPSTTDRPDPSKSHSTMLAFLYREAFGQEPKKSNGKSWIRFLRWGRSVANLPDRSDDLLRKLPIKPEKPPTLAKWAELQELVKKCEAKYPVIEALLEHARRLKSDRQNGVG